MQHCPANESPTSRLDLKADRWSNCSSFVEVVEPFFIRQNFYKRQRTNIAIVAMNEGRCFTSRKHAVHHRLNAMAGRASLVKEKEGLGSDKLIDATNQ